ncbi:MAG: hypothetical protein LLG02_05050 [Pelosinus sp.]|nr:hypothetical protein [Pelosinus sp.]
MNKKLGQVLLIFIFTASLTITTSSQRVHAANAAVATPPPQAQHKAPPPAEKALTDKLDSFVLASIITKEQAEKTLEQLIGLTPPEQKAHFIGLIKAGILNEPQALAIENTLFKNLPEGFPELPETTAVYTIKNKAVDKAAQQYIGSRQNESGVKAGKNGILNLTKSVIQTTGSASSDNLSSFYGLNAGALAEVGGIIHLADSTINTAGDGATAAFATGSASLITLANVKIHTSGDSSCGIAATVKGVIQAENIDITTLGDCSPAVGADRVNGTILIHGGVLKTAGKNSPAAYSVGNISITDTAITASASEAAIVEGRNSLTLNNTTVSAGKLWGILLFQDYTGNLEPGLASFTMNGGALTAETGPAFYATNTEGNIELTDAAITAPSKKLLEVAAGKWGTKGANGGKLNFAATRESLAGSIFCDNISTLTITLKDHTTLASTINEVRTAGSVNLNLDDTSVWNVTGTSYLSSLTSADTTLSNIHDNGFTIYYDARLAANKWLGSKTYTLKNGGKLTPSEQL